MTTKKKKRLSKVRAWFGSPTAKLSATYLAIIMVMSIAFSGALYTVSVQHLDHRTPVSWLGTTGLRLLLPDGNSFMAVGFEDVFAERVSQSKLDLLVDLVVLNLATLVLGSFLSYNLARSALRPIEQNMEAQAQFVSDASHELRTPLTALQVTNEVALRNKRLSLSDAKELLMHNVDEAKRMQQLASALLGLASPVKTELERVSVQQAVSHALTTMAPLAVEKSITIEDRTKPGGVMATQSGLAQVITILLDNAVKYSAAKTAITISSRKKGKYTEISVIDQGSGMDEEASRHVFERFYRADRARSKTGSSGYGLGLAIARKLVESYGGEISLKSKPGQGSAFTVCLHTSKK